MLRQIYNIRESSSTENSVLDRGEFNQVLATELVSQSHLMWIWKEWSLLRGNPPDHWQDEMSSTLSVSSWSRSARGQWNKTMALGIISGSFFSISAYHGDKVTHPLIYKSCSTELHFLLIATGLSIMSTICQTLSVPKSFGIIGYKIKIGIKIAHVFAPQK